MSQLLVNIIQRTARDPMKMETLFRMWEMARACGLPSTTLLTLPTLQNGATCDRILRYWEDSADELGVSFHEFQSPEFYSLHGTREPSAWLLPREVRKALYDEVIRLFVERFGFAPAAAGDYVMDAWSLRYLEENHPSVKVAVTSCFEEGVNMFRGNNHNWHLMSDGGPWMPFFPSKSHALAPARSREDAIDIVAVPHLARDMVMALSSRDDLFASHPLNLVRARINEGGSCPYHYRALDQWAGQAALNGWEYYNIFVSTGWLTEGHWAVPNMEDGKALYQGTLEAFTRLQDEGRCKVQTMSEFGKVFRSRQTACGDAHICHWKDVLNPGSKREVVWVSNSHYRVALDLNIGGTIVDLRPYAGRVEGDMGPECANLQNGSYPFLISSEHRGGFWNSGQAAFVEIEGKSVPLWESNRVGARVARCGDGWIVEADPVHADWSGGSLQIVSRWVFDSGPAIRIERMILPCENLPAGEIRITEWFGGCLGTTEYPEDLRGVVLSAFDGEDRETAKLDFAYQSREIHVRDAGSVRAAVPRAKSVVGLSAERGAEARLNEGWLFSPYFGLRLSQSVSPGQTVSTMLTIAPLP